MADELILDVAEPEVVEESKEGYDTEGMLPQEIEMAKEHGFIEPEEKEDGEHTEQSESKTEQDSEGEQQQEEKKEVDTDPDSFDKIEEVHEADEKKFHETYTPNQKALYFKNKAEKRKRQEAQKELEEIKSKYELDGVKSMVATKKLEQIKQSLGNTDLTVEQLQSIIDSEVSFKKDSKLYTKEEFEAEKAKEQEGSKKEQSALNDRILLSEEIIKSREKDYEDIYKFAEEVFKYKPSKQKLFRTMLLDPGFEEEDIAEYVIEVAKSNKKYGQGTPESKEEVNRAIKNSKKKVSSAAISTSGKTSKVPESELTVEQASSLSTDQWSKLAEKTKKRIMMGLDPD